MEDRGELGGPFAAALVAGFAGEVAAGAADEVLGDALGEGAPGQRALPGAGRVVPAVVRRAAMEASASSRRATRMPSPVSW